MAKLYLWVGLCFGLWTSGSAQAAVLPELRVYTYESLNASGGLGPELKKGFERDCDCALKLIAVGDGAQILNRIQLDERRGKPGAEIALGLDQNLWSRAKRYAWQWKDWAPRGYDELEFRVDSGFLPFDYGVFAWMADMDELKRLKIDPPKKLTDLTAPRFKKRLILEDPRTSTPGLGFLIFTQQALGKEAWGGFWRELRSQWLTLSPGWDSAYGIFLKKEAPLVWSYTTSQAYHALQGKPGEASRYRAVVFEEGNPVQVEGAVILKTVAPARLGLAKKFLEFLLSKETQELIPEKNWMLPARKGVKIPKAFEGLPRPGKTWSKPVDSKQLETLLRDWEKQVR